MLHVHKPRLRDQLDLIPYQDRASHSIGPRVEIPDDFLRKISLENDIGEL